MSENPHAKQAKVLLSGYIQMIMRKTGLQYDSDNQYELEAIVDEILAAAADEAAEEILDCTLNRKDI